jgi:hypothetical protein
MRQRGSSQMQAVLIAATVWCAGTATAGAQPAPATGQPGASTARPTLPQAGPASAPNQQAPNASGCDANCVRANNEIAGQLCASKIEAEAPTDYEWVSRPFAKIFQQAEAPEGADTVVRYRGDSIRFLSPQKEWMRVTYECGFDAATRSVRYVRVRLGRLDRPEAPQSQARVQPQTPPVPQAQQQARTSQQQTAPKRILPSEPNEIEVRQVRPSRKQAQQQ